eukprot:CAMPEP_0177648926 /NCGR_PEP_ID=MMETSP0447-20121125/11093_1 /TAXON_ID=0 /ORGANISM="Stygamoeba regulata, Strain BSH-02190019" /LENGTH=186 /DNA_ID=CAMNT_0019151609 /DNA_START=122 /DNA_END=679 /DNA_ORIENTATION=+
MRPRQLSASFTLVCALVLCIGSFSRASESLVFELRAHQEQCFFAHTSIDTPVGLRFQVTMGGFLDIDVKVTGPDDKVVYSGDREVEGKVSFVAHQTGEYKFCFSNMMSTVTPKSISFSISAGNDMPDEFAMKDHLSPLENSILLLSDGLHSVEEEQEYMKMRETVHRNTAESTNSRVMWYSLLEVW